MGRKNIHEPSANARAGGAKTVTTDERIDDIIYNAIKNADGNKVTLESIVEKVKADKNIDIPNRKCNKRVCMRLRKQRKDKIITKKGNLAIKNPALTWEFIDNYFGKK